MLENPWKESHLAAERAYGGDPQFVEREFADGPQRPIECDCGELAFWKPSICAYKCPHCSALYNGIGVRLTQPRKA